MEFVTGSNVVGSNGSIGRATKKVHRHVDQPPEAEDPTVDMNGQSVSKVSNVGVSYKEILMDVGASLSNHATVDDDFQ